MERHMFIGSRGHSGTTGIHPFFPRCISHSEAIFTDISLVQLWEVLFLLQWWQYVHGTLRRETPVNSTITVEVKTVEKICG